MQSRYRPKGPQQTSMHCLTTIGEQTTDLSSNGTYDRVVQL